MVFQGLVDAQRSHTMSQLNDLRKVSTDKLIVVAAFTFSLGRTRKVVPHEKKRKELCHCMIGVTTASGIKTIDGDIERSLMSTPTQKFI
jgi:hypothetical protein